MGADIHSVFQKKTQDGWEDIESNYDAPRHYLLFAWLGNVRNMYGIKPLSSYRGFPEGFTLDENSDEAHNGKWLGDHSHSYLSADEILSAKLPFLVDMDGNEYEIVEEFAYFIDEVQRLKDLHGNVRMVFGFDN